MVYRSVVSLFVSVLVFSVSAGEGDEELLNRLSIFNTSPFQSSRSRCYNGFGEPGTCVELRQCPSLQKFAQRYDPQFLLQTLGDHLCAASRNLRVCCTGRAPSKHDKGGGVWGPGLFPVDDISSSRTTTTTTSSWWPAPDPTTQRPTRNPNSDVWGPALFPSNDETTTTTSSPWGFDLEATTKRQSQSEEEEDPMTHRNRRLLPEEECGIQLTDKILGGENTLIEEFPWMALLRMRLERKTAFICGGSLISSRYVLTAAHCTVIRTLPSAKIDLVRLGEYDQDSKEDCQNDKCFRKAEDIPVEKTIAHPSYSVRDPATAHDIALIRLRRPAIFLNNIVPICLPLTDGRESRSSEERFWTAGWGKTSNLRDSKSMTKQKVEVPLFPFEDCAALYKKDLNVQLTDSQMCAGGEENKDSCSGDSGGPLMKTEEVNKLSRWVVRGIVSSGRTTCGMMGTPGIYTRVDKYLIWILDNLQE